MTATIRECLDVLPADPPVLRWRTRPVAHFKGVASLSSEASCKIWNKNFAGQTIRPQADGRLRVTFTVNGGERRSFDAQTVIAEIGVTTIGDLQGVPGPHQMTGSPGRGRSRQWTGALATVMREAMAETGRSMTDLSVMSDDADPYRTDTPARRRDAQWFAEQVERFVAPDRRIHPRGVFYACVSAGDVVKPDGEPFENNEEDEMFLRTSAPNMRAGLGYVDFERLVDAKENDPPIVRFPPRPNEAPTAQVWAHDLDIEELDSDALDVWTGLTDFRPRQPYRLVFFGEKTSLEDVLGPLAVEFNADLYLMSGQISDTLMHQMAKDAVADGRPLVVLTFSDFDPAGYWDMPTAIGRKLQALRDFKFPTLEFTVVHAALGPDQVRDLELPSSPLKEGERRAAKWLELYGSEQTEIDALATLQPDRLRQIARDAVAPFFDADLVGRVEAAESIWRETAEAEIAAQIDDEALDALKARAGAALDELREVNVELANMAAGPRTKSLSFTDLPEADMEALEEASSGASRCGADRQRHGLRRGGGGGGGGGGGRPWTGLQGAQSAVARRTGRPAIGDGQGVPRWHANGPRVRPERLWSISVLTPTPAIAGRSG